LIKDIEMTVAAPSAEEMARASEIRLALHGQIAKAYVGRPETIDLLLIALLARGHVLLEGVPGIAKTTLVKAYAGTLGCDFSRIQFTPDLLPADITGTYVLDLVDQTFKLRKGPLFARVVLGDEINRAPAKTQSALLEAMQECQVTIEGKTEPLPSPFIVLATQNPVEQEGVYVLPEAQVDRFIFKVVLGYPTFEEEQRILSTYNEELQPVQSLLTPQDIIVLARQVELIHISPGLIDYIVRLVQYTRQHNAVHLGGSPRASLALMRSAKARAFIHGRAYVLPDDVRALLHVTLAHRLILTPESELDRISPESVLDECFEEVPYAEVS
jgi:MoxR-like ATPase